MNKSFKTDEKMSKNDNSDDLSCHVDLKKIIEELRLDLKNKQEELRSREAECDEYIDLIEDQKEIIDIQNNKIEVQNKQISFIKKLVGTVSNIFSKSSESVPDITNEVTNEVTNETKVTNGGRKSNVKIYKSNADIIECKICNMNMRRGSHSRHLKSKNHIKNSK